MKNKCVNGMLLYFTLLFCSVSSFAVTIEEALIQYHDGEFEKAYKSFNELAAIGNIKAQYNIGVMYARGEYVEVDLAESWAWFKLVEANEGVEDVTRVIGILEQKLGAERLANAKVRLQELSQNYSNHAVQKNLLPATEKSTSVLFESARTALANNATYPQTMLRQGLSGVVDIEFLIEKDGTVRYPTVLATSNKSFTNVSLEALLKNRYIPAKLNGKPVYEYGRRMRFVFNIEGSEIDQRRVKKIVEPLKEQAMAGGGKAKYTYAYTITMIGSMGSNMEGYEDLELESANTWFSKAAQDGFSPAKYELGKRLAYGQYCSVDNTKALFWLEQAANQGLAEANLMLGMEYFSGARAQRDIEKGMQHIKRAADAGFEHAMLRYVWIVATSPESNNKELTIAKDYFNKIELKKYSDRLSYYETQAALALAEAKYQEAEKAWKKGMKELEKLKLESLRLPNLKKAIDSAQPYIEL